MGTFPNNNNINTPPISEGSGISAGEVVPMDDAGAGTGEGGNCADGETYTFVPGLPAFGIEDSWQCLAEGDNGYAEVVDEEPSEEIDAAESEMGCPDGYTYDDTFVWSDADGTYTGACVPNSGCGDNFHWVPTTITQGDCVKDDPERTFEGTDLDALIDEAGPTFTPVVACCATELGNAIATSLLEAYKSELAATY